VKTPAVLIVCNALDDSTRLLREISTDSPAASRKVFMLCQALRLAGVRPYVLSLGRGKANGSLVFHSRSVRRVGGVPVVYAPFSHIPLLSELISLISLVGTVLRVGRRRRKAVVFYNQMTAYVPTLLAAAAAGYRIVLDLKDGEVTGAGRVAVKDRLNRMVPWLFDRLCRGGALLACSALVGMTKVRPVLCYYGTAVGEASATRWSSPCLTFLMAGSLMPETGADTLIEAIQLLRRESPEWAQQVCFAITGKGTSLNAFKALANEHGAPQVVVHGRTTDAEYREILDRCEVGLALKPIGGALAGTTFPSKVIEFAGAGLLVLTTDISDVRQLLGADAIYLTSNEPQELILLLKRVADDRAAASACAEAGSRTVLDRCSPHLAGRDVANFIFGRDV
jgi:glycosyltransferase involved in cell wall biosynthesis